MRRLDNTLYRAAGVGLTLLLLAGCASDDKGMACQGKMETLTGQALGNIEGTVTDRFTSFSVDVDEPELSLESGLLQSNDRERYFPSAVTREGWLAQRLSDTRFSVINAPQDKMIVFSCPSRAI
ncbi:MULTISPECIES: hypothetical protein [Erwinia]|uniref:hypothetical protein n=1 Tax=Erwinia TaxID=551 RepID=UPI0005572A16|nr:MULTISPECIES: hypothetical protein [Erwinia]